MFRFPRLRRWLATDATGDPVGRRLLGPLVACCAGSLLLASLAWAAEGPLPARPLRLVTGLALLAAGLWLLSREALRCAAHEADGARQLRLASELHTDTVRRLEEEMKHRLTAEQQLFEAQKIDAITRLSGGVAHDFNNVITAMLGFADLARLSVPDDHPVAPDLDQIRSAGERAAALTKQLLAFSRRQVVDPRVLQADEVLRALERTVQRILGDRVRLSCSYPDAPWPVRIDLGQLEQLILQLATNARDAMPAGGTLRIGLCNLAEAEVATREVPGLGPGDYLLLSFQDDGVGMKPEVLGRCFEPLFTTKPAGRGTGLGLPSCAAIARQCGGRIAARSTPGAGSTFEVFLPRAPAKAAQPGRTAARSSRLRGSVLVVEDESQVRELAVRVLREAGCTVCEARGVAEAEALLGTGGAIDLLITDVELPDGLGRELAARIGESHSGLRVLFMSGYSDEAAAPAGERPGHQFLPKPFTPGGLVERARDALERAPL